MSQSELRVGVVGVGRMVQNMTRRLKDQEYSIVAIYDIDQARAETLAEEIGCEAAPTPARVAGLANTVLTVVSGGLPLCGRSIRAVTDSLLRHPKDRLFINCATFSPGIHIEVQSLVEAAGGLSLEACMASSLPQAQQGTLFLICGGRPEAFERAKPLLASLSADLRYVGAAGEAAKVKALVNMVMNSNTAALAEGLGFAAALGLDLTMVREIFAQTGANSRVLETDGEDMQTRSHDCYFSAAHAAKDSGIALALAERAGLHLPLAKATYEQYRQLVQLGKGELDKSAVAELTFKGRIP